MHPYLFVLSHARSIKPLQMICCMQSLTQQTPAGSQIVAGVSDPLGYSRSAFD